MASIQQLPVKTLVKVLAHLRGGEIGFDPYRDPRTSKKEALLSFILQSHSNDEIIASITAVAAASESETASDDAATSTEATITTDESTSTEAKQWTVDYFDINRRKQSAIFESEALADRFIRLNPAYQFIGKKPLTQVPTRWTPPQATTAKPTDTPPQATEALEIAKLITSMAAKGAVDETKVREICDARAQDYVDNILEAVNMRLNGFDAKIDAIQSPTIVHVIKPDESTPTDIGLQHKHFPDLLKMAQARTRDGHKLNIWLKGPAGSGKTTAAKKVAEALAQPFQFNGAISTEYELMGFKDAAGNYHRTAFREIFENGGVYLFDEVDSSLPKAVLAFNAALANGECRFPDAMIERHKDCVILAGANTAGNGATSDYVGRMKQDLAFLNRFVMLDWPLDEALEKALAANKDWVRKVQRFRANADKRGIKGHIISPRATFYGEALLAAGLSEEVVEQATLRGSLTADQWGALCQ